MNGEDTLEDTSYEVDSEKETLTLKKEYLEKLNAGEVGKISVDIGAGRLEKKMT